MSQNNPDTLVADADKTIESLDKVRQEIEKCVFGQSQVIEQVLACVLAGGHALLVGAPGLAKTLLVRTTARALGLDWARVQFTPDLMPGDILGSEVLEESSEGARSFRFIKGPVFTSLLMADEINRASPRTQSALLQAMQERHVTIAGKGHDLPAPFHVLATQNPIEQEGTYPLPEAQLDRFLLQINVPWPEKDAEKRVLIETTGSNVSEASPVLDASGLIAIQSLVRSMPVPENLIDVILELVRSARPETSEDARVRDRVEWGPSPRAGQALMLVARARALLRGRLAPGLGDIEALAEPALGHRMAVAFASSQTEHTLTDIITDLTNRAGSL